MTNLSSEGVFSAYLLYLYLLCISIAAIFIYITQNSSMWCFDLLYKWIDCVFSCFMCVCPITKNSDLPQLPCQVNSLNHWNFWLHKPNVHLLMWITTNIYFLSSRHLKTSKDKDFVCNGVLDILEIPWLPLEMVFGLSTMVGGSGSGLLLVYLLLEATFDHINFEWSHQGRCSLENLPELLLPSEVQLQNFGKI